MRTAAEVMSKFQPCSEAVEWMADRTLQAAWKQCPRGDWLLWAAGRLGVDRKLLILAACDCAETALEFVHVGEERPRRAIETARRWAAGNATLEEVEAAAAAATYAADAAAYAAARAAYTATAAAYAAARAAYTATDAATVYASDAAAYAADAAATAARAAAAAHQRMPGIVRARIPWSVVEQLMPTKETP